jgi:predicted SAM-dependent methyltransferase
MSYIEKDFPVKKCNLACWRFKIPGWINVDIDPAFGEVVADIRKLPFSDNSMEEVYLGHAAEHFHPHEHDALFNEIKRVLKPGGKLTMTVPDTRKALDLVAKGEMDLGLLCQVVYGGAENRPEQLHHSVFDSTIALATLKTYFKDVEEVGHSPYLAATVNWQSIFTCVK